MSYDHWKATDPSDATTCRVCGRDYCVSRCETCGHHTCDRDYCDCPCCHDAENERAGQPTGEPQK